MTTALALPSLRHVWLALAGLCVSLGLFCAVAVQQAQASSLTTTQINAIVTLLQSFNVDPATLQNVESALNGQSQPGTQNGLTNNTSSQIQSSSSVSFTASTASGVAPLPVSFSAGPLSTSDVYFVDFGDGTSNWATQTLCNEIAGTGSACHYQVSHNYTVAGAYVAVLYVCPDTTGVNCQGESQSLGSIAITVSSATTNPTPTNPTTSQTASFTAWPSSGTAPLTVYLTLTGPTSPSGYSVNFGDGVSGSTWTADNETANTFFMTHTYTAGGTYQPSVSNGSQTYSASVVIAGTTSAPNPTPTPTPTPSVTFSATPAGGTAPLNVTFQSNTAGSVSFGDGYSATLSLAACAGSNSAYATVGASCGYSTSHTYTTAGTYTSQLMQAGSCANSTSLTCQGTVLSSEVISVTAPACNPAGFGCTQSFLFDPSSFMASVAMAPFDLMVNSLTDIFVQFGIGQ